MSINETRARQVAFSDKLYHSPSRLITKAGSTLLPTPESLAGKTVGVAQGTTQEAYAKAKWAPKGVTVVSYANQDLIYPELLNGRIDATFTDAVVGDMDHWLHLHGDPLSEQGQAIKRGLLEQFYPDDSDWRALVGLRTQQIWERALTALTTQDYTAPHSR